MDIMVENMNKDGVASKIDEMLAEHGGFPISAHDLYAKYYDYINGDDNYFISKTAFGTYLSKVGVPKVRTGNGYYYFGKPKKSWGDVKDKTKPITRREMVEEMPKEMLERADKTISKLFDVEKIPPDMMDRLRANIMVAELVSEHVGWDFKMLDK